MNVNFVWEHTKLVVQFVTMCVKNLILSFHACMNPTLMRLLWLMSRAWAPVVKVWPVGALFQSQGLIYAWKGMRLYPATSTSVSLSDWFSAFSQCSLLQAWPSKLASWRSWTSWSMIQTGRKFVPINTLVPSCRKNGQPSLTLWWANVQCATSPTSMCWLNVDMDIIMGVLHIMLLM